ncbi:TetR/AcrR family transcriptional regulator [Nocardia sp. CDC159]|uniref:TetR/AcrR family transcriptional regulator n=1 Tax=Nocardia pulmonis TaxID=2951408 RepID=A0A9X2EDZ9_9NOCA|nr:MULTISPECIES: TetR/AcrR family transcriptional regulator [Nocardia]MCM6778714.1 TetR/AcrR family transcriptional regulator [Nocardia pulmonis]MCM6791603.1 TetR/AcrR family transcriptional regulator [Nocardia sp. CDC159]
MVSEQDGENKPKPTGRPRDPERDRMLLAAVAEILPEVGYDRMTMDAIASRAGAGRATVYRRWKDKAELVRDAIQSFGWDEPVPDTGSLRSDLLAVGAMYLDRSSPRDAMLSAIASAVNRDARLRETVERVIAEPRRAAYTAIVERARERGEIAPEADTELIAHIVPAMVFYRLLDQAGSVDGAFYERIIDSLVVPLLTGHSR